MTSDEIQLIISGQNRAKAVLDGAKQQINQWAQQIKSAEGIVKQLQAALKDNSGVTKMAGEINKLTAQMKALERAALTATAASRKFNQDWAAARGEGAAGQARQVAAEYGAMARAQAKAAESARVFASNIKDFKDYVPPLSKGMDMLRQGVFNYGQQANQATKSTQGLGHSLRRMSMVDMLAMTPGFLVATNLMMGLNAAIRFVGDATIGFNARLEQTRIAFTTIQGSAQKADKFISQLMRFAEKTPFDVEGLVKASQLLQAMGFQSEQVIEVLTDVGNAMAALGKGSEVFDRVVIALGQVQQKGRLAGQEAIQFAEAGINAYGIVAEYMGKTTAEVRKLGEEGQITSAIFLAAFQEWSRANFGGMMEKQSKTFLGALQNMDDAMKRHLSTAFEPVFEGLSKITVKSAELAQSKDAETWAQQTATAFRGLGQALKEASAFFELRPPELREPDKHGGLVGAYMDAWKLTLDIVGFPFRPLVTALNDLGEKSRKAGELAQFAAGGTQAWAQKLADLRYEITGINPHMVTFLDILDKIGGRGENAAERIRQLESALQGVQMSAAGAGRTWPLPGEMPIAMDLLTRTYAQGVGEMGANDRQAMAAYGEALKKIWGTDIANAMERIRDNISAISDKEKDLRDSASEVADAYDRQMGAIQDQIDALKEADPARVEKDRLLELKKIGLEQKLLNVKEGSYAEKIYRRQLDRVALQSRENQLAMDEKRIKGEIAAVPLEKQLEEIKKKREADLEAINEQLKRLERQRDTYNDQLKALQKQQDATKAMDPIEVARNNRATTFANELERGAKAMAAIQESAANTSFPSGPGEAPNSGLPPDERRPGQGGLGWPFAGNRTQTTIQGQGYDDQPHRWGVDWGMPVGTPLQAIGMGKIIDIITGYNQGFGNTVVLQLANGMKAFYSHLSGFAKKIGDWVNIGDVLGYSGGTADPNQPGGVAGKGFSYGPHLDFRVKDAAGKYLDVIKLLTQGIPTVFGNGQGGGGSPEDAAFDLVDRIDLAIEIINKLKKFVGPSDQVVADFAHAMQIIFSRLKEVSDLFTEGDRTNVSAFSDAMTDVLAMVELTTGVMNMVRRFKGPSDHAVWDLFNHIKSIVLRTKELSEEVGKLGKVANFAANVEAIVAPLNAVLDIMPRLRKFKGASPHAEWDLMNRIKSIIDRLKELSANWEPKTIEDLADFAMGIEAIFGPLNAALDVLNRLSELPFMKKKTIEGFFNRITRIIKQFNALKGDLKDLHVPALGKWAEKITPIFAPLAAALEVIGNLSSLPVMSRDVIEKFFNRIVKLAKGLNEVKGELDVDLEDLAPWAEQIGKVFGPISDAIGALSSLVDFKQPTYGVIRAFREAFRYLLVQLRDLAKDPGVNKAAMKLASEVAERWGKALGPVGEAISNLAELVEFKAPSQGKIDAFMRAFKMLIVGIKRLARDPAFEGEKQLDKAMIFSQKAVTIVNAIQTALSAFTQIVEGASAPSDAIGALIKSMGTALAKMDELVAQSEAMLERARKYRDNSVEAARLIAEGTKAIGGRRGRQELNMPPPGWPPPGWENTSANITQNIYAGPGMDVDELVDEVVYQVREALRGTGRKANIMSRGLVGR